MTDLADAGPPAAPDLGHRAVAMPPGPVLRLAARLLIPFRHLFRVRRLDASDLTERQLADVGLTRADLPDRRGWQRWPDL